MAVYRVSVSVMYLDPTRSVHRVHGVHGKGGFPPPTWCKSPMFFGGFGCFTFHGEKVDVFFCWRGEEKSSDMFMWRTKNMSAMMVFLGGIRDFSPLIKWPIESGLEI